MKRYIILFLIIINAHLFGQQKVSGKIFSENNFLITNVLVVNVSNNKKTYSDSSGNFTIEASENDEIRFSKSGYERVSRKVSNVESLLSIVLLRVPELIEEVKMIHLTGNLKKDSKTLTKVDKVYQLQKDIGLPKPPEIMREKAPELSEVFAISFPVVVISINIDALYKIISGDSRRMKSLYKYEDLHRQIKWVLDRIDPEYYKKSGIPIERISEFLEFAFLENPKLLDFVKSKNINGVTFEIENAVPVFKERLDSRSVK